MTKEKKLADFSFLFDGYSGAPGVMAVGAFT
jgi:hypothetical protein